MQTVLIATTNPGKIREITEIFKDKYIRFLSLADFSEFESVNIPETGDTYQANALIKARTFGRLSGLITMSDDSGLNVDILDGRPGILSKRYASTDEARIVKLLDELKTIPMAKRSAHFTCAMAVFDPSSEISHFSEGKVEGFIANESLGKNGFGYDPIFYCPEIGKTFGEASEEEKNRVSHRAKALVGVAEILRKHFI